MRKLTPWLPFLLVTGASATLLLTLSHLDKGTWRVETEVLSTLRAERKLPRPESLALPPEFRMMGTRPRLPLPEQGVTPATARPLHQRNLLEHILALRARPDTGAMNALLARLEKLPTNRHGGQVTISLARAYDWLYSQWSVSQREALRARLLVACEQDAEYIRLAKLSPYNMYLYNGPLQAIMACAIALYGEHPRGHALMAFAYDLWKNRVLPVWHQVMGRNGGWHEGGEHVIMGVGQAIYQVPYLWRHATGENLFDAHPGIRGFLDFLAHREQPDSRYVPWGDTGYYTTYAPDKAALARETGHDAATLPLARLFDGIGMVFARSGWNASATHVSFRAGDNHWSHTHLDQGAFTIYKGGQLAIDSGMNHDLRSDHHLNYAYQSIAHNTITVTDPDDTVPMRMNVTTAEGLKTVPRPIANDGGQRRVGSGWGVDDAPLDLDDWRARRDTYYTGLIERYHDADGLTVAVADITPAYSNSRSGQGTFSSRTLRVERLWRVFAYDRVNDVVVVFDNVESTQASFKKRWLLHSAEQPALHDGGFRLSIEPDNQLGHAGGALQGWVLLPSAASINPVGGPGQEFWVDGISYDDRGLVRQRARWVSTRSRNPGAWRLEVSPPSAHEEDLFLVVMAPTLQGARAPHQVELIRHEQWVGASVRGPQRSTRLWFSPVRNGVLVDVSDGHAFRRHEIWGTSVVRDDSVFERWRDIVLYGH